MKTLSVRWEWCPYTPTRKQVGALIAVATAAQKWRERMYDVREESLEYTLNKALDSQDLEDLCSELFLSYVNGNRIDTP